MQCRGIGRQLQQLSSDSTPHDRVTIPQICLARSPALDRPPQSTLRYPTGVSNRPTGHHARRDPLPIHQPLHRPPTRCGGSIPITNISRGSQISITPVARPSVPLRAVSSLGGFRTPTAELAAPSLMRPASETLHMSGHSQIRWNGDVCFAPGSRHRPPDQPCPVCAANKGPPRSERRLMAGRGSASE